MRLFVCSLLAGTWAGMISGERHPKTAESKHLRDNQLVYNWIGALALIWMWVNVHVISWQPFARLDAGRNRHGKSPASHPKHVAFTMALKRKVSGGFPEDIANHGPKRPNFVRRNLDKQQQRGQDLARQGKYDEAIQAFGNVRSH